MSLDIYLTREKWTSYNKGKTWCKDEEEVYSRNITHNLNTMASKAGIYYALWHPYMINKSKAKELIPYLEKGLKYLKSAPDKYKKYDSPNGWGLYIHFVPFVEGVLEACKEYPDADVMTST